MLVLLTETGSGVPEETDLDVDFDPKSIEQGVVSVWVGHPLRLRGVLRSGLQVEIGLSKAEFALILHTCRNGGFDDNQAVCTEFAGSSTAATR